MALFALMTGWVVLSDAPLLHGLHWLMVTFVVLVAGAISYAVYRHNKIYFEIACVVQRINRALGLFQPGRYGATEGLYPQEWSRFGSGPQFFGWLRHALLIIGMGVICATCAFVRAHLP